MISTVVLLLATFAFVSASPVAERQSGCTPPAIPTQCARAQADLSSRLSQILANPNSMTAQQIRDVLLPFLNTLCGSTCLSPSIAALRCLNQTDLLDFSLRGICGRNGNTYCAIAILDLGISGTSPIPTCAASGSCPSDCRSSLTTISNRLGCCAASWYGISSSPYASVGNQYRTCGVSLGSACPAAGGVGSTAHYLSILLLIVASALAIVVL